MYHARVSLGTLKRSPLNCGQRGIDKIAYSCVFQLACCISFPLKFRRNFAILVFNSLF